MKQWLGMLEGRGFEQSPHELTLVGLLLAAVLWPALSFSAVSLIVLVHGLFLLLLYVVGRTAFGQLHALAGSVFFAATVLLLAAEFLVAQTTGLHLNLFVLNLLLEAGAAENIGLPGTALLVPLLALGTISLLARRFMTHRWAFKKRVLLAATLLSLAATQLLYGYFYFTGTPDVMETRRKLPFFAALHPYRVEQLFAPVLGPRPQNPFSLEKDMRPALASAIAPRPLGDGRNVLFIIIDSLRGQDVADDPTLAPSLAAWATQGDYRLDHISTANCTHFSFYSLFTGDLPTDFSRARRTRPSRGLIPRLRAGGYRISTAEALSLDWYDLSRILGLSGRAVATEGTAADRDRFVTESTLQTLTAPQEGPFFHLAYYNGLHFPYGDTLPVQGLTGGTADTYRAAIGEIDQQIGRLLHGLRAAGRLNNTLVIITSDHGEELMENGRLGHASALSDAQLRVPMLILGARTDTSRIISHRDLLPFLKQELGTEDEAVTFPRPAIAANCSFAYPTGFSVFDAQGARADFLYEDGFLSPVRAPDGTAVSPDRAKAAAIELISAINE